MTRVQAGRIRLGDKEWLVRPLTIAQVQEIEPVLLASSQAPQGNIASALAILRVALARDHAKDLAGLEMIEAGASEISAAMAAVLRLGGFLPAIMPGEPLPGEAEAGETPAV